MKPTTRALGTSLGGWFELRRLQLTAFLGFLLLPFILLAVTKSNARQLPIVNLRVSTREVGDENLMMDEGLMNITMVGAIHNNSVEVQRLEEAEPPSQMEFETFSLTEFNNTTAEEAKVVLKYPERGHFSNYSLPVDLIKGTINKSEDASRIQEEDEATDVLSDLRKESGGNSSLTEDINNVMTNKLEEVLSIRKDKISDVQYNQRNEIKNNSSFSEHVINVMTNYSEDALRVIKEDEDIKALSNSKVEIGANTTLPEPEDFNSEIGSNTSLPETKNVIKEFMQDLDQKKQPTSNSTVLAMSSAKGDKRHEGNIECDFTHPRTDVCEMQGDIRINGPSSSIMLIEPPPLSDDPTKNNSIKIRPYARKWEGPTMSTIKELSLLRSLEESDTPKCSTNHTDIPAVVFSTGGFQGNFFHDLTDVLVPLFLTTHKYNKKVQFLIVDFKPSWVRKYQPILSRLSGQRIIDLDSDAGVHCYRRAVVGLSSHRELGIDPSQSPEGSSMAEFRKFLRDSYSLSRDHARGLVAGSNKRAKPRLLFMSRKKSRAVLNEKQAVRMARGLGFKVVVATAAATRNLTRFAATVNSCDVMVGVHGAGLSNMVFLPDGAAVVQVVPWGGLAWACRTAFGEPAEGMGLRYIEYEVGVEESSLVKEYPRGHPVLADPMSVHRRGFAAVWSVFLDRQDVRLDLRRFREVLLGVMKNYSQ